jgi:hypothetical protein
MGITVAGKHYDKDYVLYDDGTKISLDIFKYKMDEIEKRLAAKMLIDNYGIRIRQVIFSGPATIVFWNDGDKTVVKCMEGDPLNYEMGIAMCTLKKLFGEEGYRSYKKHVKELLQEEKSEKGNAEDEAGKT